MNGMLVLKGLSRSLMVKGLYISSEWHVSYERVKQVIDGKRIVHLQWIAFGDEGVSMSNWWCVGKAMGLNYCMLTFDVADSKRSDQVLAGRHTKLALVQHWCLRQHLQTYQLPSFCKQPGLLSDCKSTVLSSCCSVPQLNSLKVTQYVHQHPYMYKYRYRLHRVRIVCATIYNYPAT